MNFTVSAYTGGRAVTFTATSDGVSTVVRSGSQATLEAVVVHMGLKGERGEAGGSLSAIAATTLSGHIAVTLNELGHAIAADNSIATHGGSVVGITTGAAVAGSPVAIADKGALEHLGWTFTPDQPVYLGAAGQITQSPPLGQFIKVLGMAKTATRVTISIQPAIYFN